MPAGEECKNVAKMLGDTITDEQIAQLPQISAPNGEGFMHHRLQMTALHTGMYKQQPSLEHRSAGHPIMPNDAPSPSNGVRPLTATASPVHTPLKDHARPSLLDMTEDERVRRRREINRNSQRRIRERRMKELEELRTETTRLQQDNDQLLREVKRVTAEKEDLLRQIQETTEKWQHSVAENAVLNRENLQLRSSLQQITGITSLVTGSIAGGVPAQNHSQMEALPEKQQQQEHQNVVVAVSASPVWEEVDRKLGRPSQHTVPQ